MKLAEFRGAYNADRAAALSGVPRTTIHYWARHEVLIPSISQVKTKLWSYSDLMGLRTIYWLRQRKLSDNGAQIPATTMPTVRRALAMLRDDLDLGLFTEDGRPTVAVDLAGKVFILTADDDVSSMQGDRPLDPDLLNLIRPFTTHAGQGPDLHTPRPHLRIVPGKLSGSPHIQHSRIETSAIASLRARGFATDAVEKLYPSAPPLALVEAYDLEQQLDKNLRTAA